MKALHVEPKRTTFYWRKFMQKKGGKKRKNQLTAVKREGVARVTPAGQAKNYRHGYFTEAVEKDQMKEKIKWNKQMLRHSQKSLTKTSADIQGENHIKTFIET